MTDRDKEIQIIIGLMTDAEEHSKESKAVWRALDRFEKTLTERQRAKWEALQEPLKAHQGRVSHCIFHMGMAYQYKVDEERQSGIH